MTVAPLDGRTILDLGQNITCPVACMLLRGMGAEIVKVEMPGTGDHSRKGAPYAGPAGITYDPAGEHTISLSYLKRNRGKRSVALDLKSTAGRTAFERLAASADAVVENFRPGTLERLGIGFDALQALNPRISLCSITGFGESGKYSDWLAYDGIVQAFSGVVERTGYPDGPPVRSGFPVADGLGSLFAALGVMGALEQARRTGRGIHVEVSMLECILFMLWDNPEDFFAATGESARAGNWNRRVSPWDMYPARDGYVFVCVMKDAQWRALATVLGIDPDDARFGSPDSRLANRAAVDALVTDWCRSRGKDDIAETLQRAGVPCSAVRRPVEVAADPEFRGSGLFRNVPHPGLDDLKDALCVRFPIRGIDSGRLIDTPAPVLGADTADVLHSLGMDAASIAALAQR